MALKYLTAIVTQSAADTFTEAEVPTGLAAIGNQAFRIIEIVSQISSPGQVDNATLRGSLTRKSFASDPNITERSLIYKRFVENQFTTSGYAVFDRLDRQKFDTVDDLLVVEDPLFIQCTSTLTTAANVFQIRIGYQQVRISEVDRLQIIANTLSS